MNRRYGSGRDRLIGVGQDQSLVALDPVAHRGALAFRGASPPELSDGTAWRRLVTEAASSSFVVTVGPSGQHPNIAAALDALRNVRPRGATGAATVSILTGHTETVPVRVATDMSWVSIVSADAVVPVTADACAPIGEEPAPMRGYFVVENGASPNIRCAFSLTGVTWNGATDGAGAEYVGLYMSCGKARVTSLAGFTFDNQAGFRGFSTNLSATRSSLAVLSAARLTDSRRHNIVISASQAVALSCDFSSASLGVSSGNGVRVAQGGAFRALNTTARITGVDSTSDWVVAGGGTLSIDSSCIGGVSQEPHVPTVSGIIFDARVTERPRFIGRGREWANVASLPAAASNLGAMASVAGVPHIARASGWVSLVDEARATEIAENVSANALRTLDGLLEITVGATGDFPDLADAIAFLGRFAPVATVNQEVLARVTILAGHQIAKPVIQVGTNLGWVEVVSQDEEVPVLPSAFLALGGASTAAFYTCRLGTTPQMQVLFRCAVTLWSGGWGHVVNDPASPAFGRSAAGLRLDFASARVFSADENRTPGFCGFSTNVVVGHNSTAELSGSYTDGRRRGVSVSRGGSSVITGATIRGGENSLHVTGGAVRIWSGGPNNTAVDFRKTAGVDSADDLFVSSGAHVVIDDFGAHLGGLPQPAFVQTRAGLIIDYRALRLPFMRAVDLGSAAFFDAGALRGRFPVAAGAAYQIVADDWGRTLIAESGTLTWTLPVITQLPDGWWVQVWNRSGNTLTIQRAASAVIGASATSITIADGSGVTLARRDDSRFERIA
jgi:hypothetical protein